MMNIGYISAKDFKKMKELGIDSPDEYLALGATITEGNDE